MHHATNMNKARHKYECHLSHTWMSHVTPTHKSRDTYERVVRLRHVTHMNESCHTHEWVAPHIWLSHVTRTNESRHKYEAVVSHVHDWMRHVRHRGLHCPWVTLRVRMSHVTNMNQSCHTYMYECDIEGYITPFQSQRLSAQSSGP